MSFAHWYAVAVVRLRWVIVAGWALLVLALSLTLPTLEDTGGTGGFRGFAEPDHPAIQAEIRSFEKFGFPVLTRTAIVQHNPEGLSPATQFEIVSDAIDFNLDRPPELQRIEFALPVLDSFLPSRLGQQPTTAITYLFYRPDVGFGRQTGLAAEYGARYAGEPDDHLVGVTGVIPGRIAQLVILRRTLEKVEIATVVLILLVVALSFRALGAPLVTVATAGIAVAVIVRLAGLIGQELGVDVPSEIEPVLVALLLGIVTDYSIFFLSGMKERLASGEDRLEAATASTTEFAPIVVVAGVTVAAGSLALLVARVGLFRTFGPGMAITILISVVVAVTFVPACLAILGRWVFWPRIRTGKTQAPLAEIPRSRLVTMITRKPNAVRVIVIGGGVLLFAALPVRNLDLGFAVIDSLPSDYEARRAAEAAGEGFAPGILSPTVLLLEAPGIGELRPELDRLQHLLDRQPGVAVVAGPANQPSPVSVGAVVSTAGDAARYVVVFDANPLSATTIDNLHQLRERMPALLAEAGIPQARMSYAGDTALAESTVTQTKADLGRIVLVATGFGFVLLVLFLRALVAPLYLMAANVLAVAAALGVTTFVFQSLAGNSGLTFYVPFAAAVLLVALGADYSIFGVGYIWSEARQRPLVEAIRVAVPRSTRAINAAGITLALSFAMLAFVPLRPFREFALAMSAGIIFDVFVVRSLLIPSLVSLVGKASGWPGATLRAHDGDQPGRRPVLEPVATPGAAREQLPVPDPGAVGRPVGSLGAPPRSSRSSRRLASFAWVTARVVAGYLLDRKRRRGRPR